MASIAATAIDQPLTAVQGATFEMSWIFQDVDGVAWDFTGYTAKADIRRAPGMVGTPILSASTVNGYITFPGSGELRITIPYADIVALTFPGTSVEYWWDLEITKTTVTPNRILKPFLPSTFTIIKEVTL